MLSRKRPISFSLKIIRRPGVLSGSVSRRGNVTPASSGRVAGPAACTARRGPDGVRGAGDFCDPAKISNPPEFPRATTLPASGRPAGNRRHHFPQAGHCRRLLKNSRQCRSHLWLGQVRTQCHSARCNFRRRGGYPPCRSSAAGYRQPQTKSRLHIHRS